MGVNGHNWQPDEIETLKKMHIEQRSAQAIGRALGRPRSSVLSKLKRLGLAKTEQQARLDESNRHAGQRARMALEKSAEQPIQRRPLQMASKPPIPFQSPHARLGGVSLMNLHKHGCRFGVSPHGETEHLFCNAVSLEGSKYCEEHEAICRTGHRQVFKFDRRLDMSIKRVRI